MLCPPDSGDEFQGFPNTTVSFGVVAIRLHDEWGAVSFSAAGNTLPEQVTHHRSNLVCQQMGFQQVVPGSVRTLSAVINSSSYTFDHCFSHG